MINNVVLVGRLTKDPDLRYTGNGTAVASFTVAVDRNFTNTQGNRETDFINCVVWRKQAETFANYMHKGSLVGVEGRLQTRNYEGNDGKRVYVTEVLVNNFSFLEPKGSGGGNNNSDSSNPPQPNTSAPTFNGTDVTDKAENPFADNDNKNGFDPDAPLDISDDDLPF
ncbi:single-stranded DNA-binding protein [Xylocopilactobacillus apicola]|uniref:Single-stranded DNA-binding protein n=1 Tax=Xylocopilactobacillus apicola TaxID=2932184 RepID=A0AAU9D8K8_9LACO|nr:single-stranded DNA-binding protein [Xylocopilactobacillus apicola]BDR57805.1 single-stranded DNA-binding protein [Xylocopilactobacillus apicola]